MKADRYAKDLFKKLDKYSFSNGHNNGHSSTNNDEVIIYDDYYYIDRGSRPPRFQAYRHARWEKLDEWGRLTCEDVDKTTTQDELDFALKRDLRMTPEERYQLEKRSFLFHDLSCYMRDLSDEEYGCDGGGCIPECRFYAEYGRIEDEEVIEEHNKFVEKLRNENRIVEPPHDKEMLRILKELKHLF